MSKLTAEHPKETQEHSSTRVPVSISVYFLWVALITSCFLGLAAWLHPALTHDFGTSLGVIKPMRANSNSFYLVRVQPVLDAHCVSCHGATRQKSDLRVNDLEGVLRGGSSGAVVIPKRVDRSELLRRILLPPNDVHAMPPKGAKGPSADEVTVLKLWIASGASGSEPVSAIKNAPPLPKIVAFPEVNELDAARRRAPIAAAVQALQARFPGLLVYESRGDASLLVNAFLFQKSFGDSDLAALAPIADNIVYVDASRTALTDASAQWLASLKHLRELRLAETRVGDATVASLSKSSSLREVNLTGNNVTPAALQTLREKGVRIYAAAIDTNSGKKK